MTKAITLTLADEYPVFLGGLEGILGCTDEFAVLSTATDGLSALESICVFQPDIAVLDISMPQLDGLDVLGALSTMAIPTKVVFLVASVSIESFVAAMNGGAWGVLFKGSAVDVLVRCFREIAAGNRCLDPELGERPFQRSSQKLHAIEAFELLTTREREIALLAAEGLSNKNVARRINISEGTVKIHLYNIYQKLEIANRTSLAVLANTYLNHSA